MERNLQKLTRFERFKNAARTVLENMGKTSTHPLALGMASVMEVSPDIEESPKPLTAQEALAMDGTAVQRDLDNILRELDKKGEL